MDIKKIIEAIKEMKVIELNELVKAIEEEFGVTAAAPVAAAAGADAGAASSEKTVKITSAGGNKIAVIKLIREIKGLGLMEAKQFVESLPATIGENMPVDQADELVAKIKETGAEAVAE